LADLCPRSAGFTACISTIIHRLIFTFTAGDAAKIDIDTLQVIEGELRRRTLALVLEWAVEHRDALLENWCLAEAHRPLNPIAPLE
jgi:hypothetical protein